MLSTSGRFATRDGDHLEARVWVPRGAGLWPAFWTVPDDRWPPETDVFEYFDTGRQSRPMFNHHPRSGGQTGPSPYGNPDVDHRESWHVYGLLRSGGLLLPHLDGVADPALAVPCDPGDPPMSVLFDLAVYRDARPPAGAQLRIDWVRAWRPAGDDRPAGAAR
jgi:beta-glucanase (GH16 family)